MHDLLCFTIAILKETCTFGKAIRLCWAGSLASQKLFIIIIIIINNNNNNNKLSVDLIVDSISVAHVNVCTFRLVCIWMFTGTCKYSSIPRHVSEPLPSQGGFNRLYFTRVNTLVFPDTCRRHAPVKVASFACTLHV